jgi:hypothetical protein
VRNYLRDIVVAMADKKIDFVIAGGVAVVLHGVERVTLDLDVSLSMESKNLKRFLAVMKDRGMTPRAPVPPETLLDAGQLDRIVKEKHAVVFTFVDADNPLKQVDVFLRDHLRYEVLAGDAVTVEIGGRPVRIVSRRRLIAMKRRVRPPRPKDRWDADELEKLGR